MLRRLLPGLIFSSFLFSSALAADKYTFDSNHSFVEFHIKHLGFSSPTGKWPVEGTLELDETKPQNSKVNVTIHTAKVVTGVTKLDEHLQDAAFFDVKQYPMATFVSNKVVRFGKNNAKVYGVLTIKNIAKPIVLAITLNKMGENMLNKKMTAGFSGSTKIKRSDFGITALMGGLSDEVKLDIEAEVQK